MKYIPKWEDYPPIREVNNPQLGKILCDVSSRLEAGNQYEDRDKITSTHEQTHGINSYARMKFQRGNLKKVNCFYCLQGRICVIEEPNVTLPQVAMTIPKEFRGDVYQLYLVNQARQWADTPLYCLDEFVSYLNGTECYRELGIKERESTIWQTFEFINYIFYLHKFVVETRKNYDDGQLRNFIGWNVERSMRLYREEEGAKKYLDLLRKSIAGNDLRNFIKSYYGVEWYEKTIVREMFW